MLHEFTTVSPDDALMLFAQSMEDDMEKNQNFLDDNHQQRIQFFTLWVNNLHDGGLTYLEAIVDFCDKHDVEYDKVTKLITETMRQQIYDEAVSFNQIKRTEANVPSFL